MEKAAKKVSNLLKNYTHYKELAEETEELRELVDSLMQDDADDALRLMIEIDTNMLELMDYHVMLSTNCLKLLKMCNR